MNLDSAYPILKLFIAKANKLEESSFLKSIHNEFRIGLKVKVGNPVEINSVRPQQESIDAFILTFRFFIQDNEAISLRNLQKIFESKLVTKSEKKEYDFIRTELKDFLSEGAKIEIKEDKPTNLEVMETVLWGELAHTNENKKKRYEKWMNTNELFQELIWHSFIISIIKIVIVIQRIKLMLCDVIDRNLAISSKIFVLNYGTVRYTYINNNSCINKLVSHLRMLGSI